MANSAHAQTPSPAMSANKPMTGGSPSPAPSLSSASVAPQAASDFERDQIDDTINKHRQPQQPQQHRGTLSNSDNVQPRSPTYIRYSPSVPTAPGTGSAPERGPGTNLYNGELHQPADEQRSYYRGRSGLEHGPGRDPQQVRDGGYVDPRERHQPPSPYHPDASYYNGPTSTWSRAASPPGGQGSFKHLSFTRHGPGLHPRSSPPHHSYTSRPQNPDMAVVQGMYPPSAHVLPGAPRANHVPDSYQAKRHRNDSDSDAYSDYEARYRHGHDIKSHRDREPYLPPSSYQYADPNIKPHGYGDSSRDYHRHYHHHSTLGYSALMPPEGLSELAPRPPRYSMDEDSGSGSTHHMQTHIMHGQSKRESARKGEPFKIQSARGTPKGPLPIDVQISLLSSVLKHDPFNCAIRKTTKAWELISREQGIRARTCSRRFDNIIQASIAGRDRPVGTEEQQVTKKRLLEQLFEMMNQPQALKRMQKKRRYRSEDTDRRLLQETIRLNPFAQKVGQVAKAWEDVRDALNMKVHARQCIRRVNRMVKPYQLRERMYKGNIPDEMKEANDDLVKQVIQLMRLAGQGGSLDDACNSNDEDSNSCISDSDEQDQEDAYIDPKEQDHIQEDDELEDDEDDEMASRSESEQRHQAQRMQEGSNQPKATTPLSPAAHDQYSPSTQPATPSFTAQSQGALSASATPAKRGRPRNPAPTAQHIRPSSHAPSVGSALTGESEASESKASQPSTNDGPDIKGEAAREHGSVLQRTPLSSPTSMRASSAGGGPEPEHGRAYPPGDNVESNEYRRPIKHARTDSRGAHDIHHGHDRDETAYNRYANIPNSGRGPAAASHGRSLAPSHDMTLDSYVHRGQHAGLDGAPVADVMAMHAGPSAQQYREVVNELHSMRDYLAQMDERRRAEMDKQMSMMYTIEKLQHQVQQQQQQLGQLQHQLRYGHPSSSLSSQPGPPPPSQQQPTPSPLSPAHSYQQSPHPPSGPQGSATPSGGRYSATPLPAGGPPLSLSDRHSSEMVHHVSYSRSDTHYAPRDRDLR
ncbi:hypothetical protein BGZ99_006281 [Dissophora globulifera]|uniref:Uncharacterized protein n=1 Tax=Dissophora globulifera TaxID=979702 RepID=A0A9P6REW8_9FUNG|nr:hypothetical protein BGZ99_006281 [Dissophora globulifera]